MTIADFTDLVASYSNRIAALFTTVGAQDVILAAMNDARRDAQRRYTFNMCKQQAFATLSMKPVSLATGFTSTPGGTTLVVKRVDSLWEYGTTTVSATSVYYPTRELDLRKMAGFKGALSDSTNYRSAVQYNPTTDNFAYFIGTNLFHSNLTTPTSYMGEVVAFLPDLASGDSPDIFLTYFTDWLKFATLSNLNVWLKDSEQIQINAQVFASLWNSVTQFDAQQAELGVISLD